jgi:formate-dependent nitrite reductase membrane component NrfD
VYPLIDCTSLIARDLTLKKQLASQGKLGLIGIQTLYFTLPLALSVCTSLIACVIATPVWQSPYLPILFYQIGKLCDQL